MTSDFPPVNGLGRRDVLGILGGGLAGLAALASGPLAAAAEPARPVLNLRLKPGTMAFGEGQPEQPAWLFESGGGASTAQPIPHFRRGEQLTVNLVNDLPVPVVLNWYGLDGAAKTEPLLASPPLAPGQRAAWQVPLRGAGSYFYNARLLGDGQAQPLPSGVFVVDETNAPTVDHDEVLLIEDWRPLTSGGLAVPGRDAGPTTARYTVNGKLTTDIAVRANARLRCRFINGCQRNAIAFKIDGHVARIMAIDGQPAEPFPARDGRLILAPGSRIDAFIDTIRPPGSIAPILLHDGTTPRPIGRLVYSSDAPLRDTPLPPATELASNGLPARLDLQGALRSELTVSDPAGAPAGEWLAPVAMSTKTPPAFRVKRGRTVVLTLLNRGPAPSVFHLHGHHFRLLDRLDDGWKPFWLDTLLLDAGQTSRVAFAAEFAGNWLLETMTLQWTSSVRLRWFAVD